MEQKEKEVIIIFLQAVKTDLVKSLRDKGRYASGETEADIEIVETANGFQLIAPGYITILETGRGATAPNAPIGDPTVFQNIVKWINAKGLNINPYAVTRNIHKNGYLGKPGVVSIPLDNENLDKHLNEQLGDLANILITETLKIQ